MGKRRVNHVHRLTQRDIDVAPWHTRLPDSIESRRTGPHALTHSERLGAGPVVAEAGHARHSTPETLPLPRGDQTHERHHASSERPVGTARAIRAARGA